MMFMKLKHSIVCCFILYILFHMKKSRIYPSFQDQFLDSLLKKAWFQEDDFDLLKEDLRPVLQERIMLMIGMELNQQQEKKAYELLSFGDYTELTAYLEEQIPQFEELLMETYAQFEDEYLENFEKEK